jgi:hypothetical protein
LALTFDPVAIWTAAILQFAFDIDRGSFPAPLSVRRRHVV